MSDRNERTGLGLLGRTRVQSSSGEEEVYERSEASCDELANVKAESGDKSSPVSPQALENEMKKVLDSLWNFKDILVEFQQAIETDCVKSLAELSMDFQAITHSIEVFHEDLRLKTKTTDKIQSVRGIGGSLSGSLTKIEQRVSRDEERHRLAGKITPLINTYSDMIEKVSLLESNLATFFRKNKSQDERKEQNKAQAIMGGSSAIIRSQELERQRIAREIHDGPAQAIANVIFRLDIVQKVMEQKPSAIPDEMVKVKEIAQGALNEIRSFIFDLRPMTLQDLGLIATLRKIIHSTQGKFNTKVELMVDGEEKELDPEKELAIFRIAQESLNNVRKHAKANNAWVQLKYFEDKVVLIVEDNGNGFDLKKKTVKTIDEYNSFGLLGMQERADDIGGTFQITSQPMRGTKVIFTLPIEQ